MVILDTKIFSPLMRPLPDLMIVSGLNRQAREDIYTTSVTIFEIRFGLIRLPAGQKCILLSKAFEAMLEKNFDGRVLPVDREAAEKAGALPARRQAQGKVIDNMDTLIAGIALSRRASIATRNVKHFDDLNLPIITP